MVPSRVSERTIKLVLSDVDGTLVPHDKVLTKRSIEAVHQLHEAGILFALTSARPPQGLAMFIKPLEITTPLSAFNGGLVTDTDLNVIEEKTIDDHLSAPIAELLGAHGLSVWVYQGPDWYVLDAHSVHVEHEAQVCECEPAVLKNFAGVETGVTKIVGVSDDEAACVAASTAIQSQFGGDVLATRSQSYFVDVTNVDANKGNVVRFLSTKYDIPFAQIATIGDMHNDLSMFAVSGFSIAMGQSDSEIQAAASVVTTSNEDEGFANAMTRYILNGS
jgi:Cof subfamily protein (haloacid dehalogenase superfamily)